MQPIVVVSADREFGKQLTTAVNAAGATGHLHTSIDALGQGSIEAVLLVLHLTENPLASLAALLPRLVGDTRVIAILPRADLVAAVDVMRASDRVNAMMVAERFDSAELAGVATRLLAGDIFGLEKTVRWGTRVYSQLVGAYPDKAIAISCISEFAQQMNVRRKYRDSIEQCVDEMLMNALYDAPVDAEGRPLFSDLTAKTRVALETEHKVLVQYACDGKRFVVSVRDGFGTLERGTVLQYLHKCLHAKQQIDTKAGGAGLGLYLMVNSATNVLFNVMPGVATEVVCSFDLESPKPQLEELAFINEKVDDSARKRHGKTRPAKRRPRWFVRILTAAIAVVVGLIGVFGWERIFPGRREADAIAQAARTAVPLTAPLAVSAVVDWETCDAALTKAAAQPLALRPAMVISGCQVCGDWDPILRWATLETEGGPSRSAIEAAMMRCGFCNPNAKQRFLGTLDNARGTTARTPWRQLGELCQGQVSATPDNRFTNAPFYALDRIARAGFARGGGTAEALAALELPLPAASITGIGIALPDLKEGVLPDAGPVAITMIGDAIHVARLPRARMRATGLAVELGDYPGDRVALPKLAPLLRKLVTDDPAPVALLAPRAMPAQTVVPVIAAAASVSTVYLAVNAPDSPVGWVLPGTLPIALVAKGRDAYVISAEATVENLATELANRLKFGQKTVPVVVKRQPPP